MKKIKIGHDYESSVREEYKDKIFGKIGGYVLIQIDDDIIIQGKREIRMSQLFEPLVQYKLATGKSLKFMHDDFDISMDRIYDIVNVPLLKDDFKNEFNDGTDQSKAFLTYWTFNTREEAMEMLGFLTDLIGKVTIINGFTEGEEDGK